MQQVKRELKKIKKQLGHGGTANVAKALKIPYQNVATAFRGAASEELSVSVLKAAQKIVLAKKKKNRRVVPSHL